MSTSVEAVRLETLTLDEERDRLHLERKVEHALYDQGMALRQLRDRRLYRSTHSSWEAYLRDRFNMGRHNANYIITATRYVENIVRYYVPELVTSGHQSVSETPSPRQTHEIVEVEAELVTSGHQATLNLIWDSLPENLVLPTQEKQVRSLRNLPEERHGEAWDAAVKQNGGRPPTSTQVVEVVRKLERQLQERAVTPNPFQVGQVGCIQVGDNPDLRGLGGAPAVVIEANEFSCTVRTGLGDRLVLRHNLEAMDLTAWEEQQMRDRLERLFRLTQADAKLDPLAQTMVRELSKQPSPYLSPFQEQALRFLEEQYGLDADEAEVVAEEPVQSPPAAARPLLTSPPDWAREEVGADPQLPPAEEPPFFTEGDAVRVCENHSFHANATGLVTEIHETIAIVKLDGVRKPVALPFCELEKATLPPAQKPKPPRGDGSG